MLELVAQFVPYSIGANARCNIRAAMPHYSRFSLFEKSPVVISPVFAADFGVLIYINRTAYGL